MERETIVLCSASPRRQQLLKELGFDFEAFVKDVDESFPQHLKAEKVALFLAEKKSEAFRKSFTQGKIYITADTIVCINDVVLGKPAHEADAFRMLKTLSGNCHQVYTGVCLGTTEGRKSFHVRSDVYFKELDDEKIKSYIDSCKPFDKAGSYGAQECLPEGLNPCSLEEKEFLQSINKSDLFEKTRPKEMKHIPMIERIEGSYFNVMGLPVVELYKGIMNYKL